MNSQLCPHCGQPMPPDDKPNTQAAFKAVKVQVWEKRKRYRRKAVVQVVDFYRGGA